MPSPAAEAFERLARIMDELREQCPWDRKQTIQSLRQMTIEETYELADAITENDWKGIREELGDLLLHIVFMPASAGNNPGLRSTSYQWYLRKTDFPPPTYLWRCGGQQ